MNINLIHLKETNSTNEFIRTQPLAEEELLVVTADYQTAGYGQKGNSWEGERGKNLLMSLSFHANFIPATTPFLLSELLSVCLCDTLNSFYPSDDWKIKWPNDLYFKDRKICGFLVSYDMQSMKLGRCIVGIGLNVNQRTFRSDAPNPVSLAQITERDIPLTAVRDALLRRLMKHINGFDNAKEKEILQLYQNRLYRNDGYYPYKDAKGKFLAKISEVLSDGRIRLIDKERKPRLYAFKEVEILLTNE